LVQVEPKAQKIIDFNRRKERRAKEKEDKKKAKDMAKRKRKAQVGRMIQTAPALQCRYLSTSEKSAMTARLCSHLAPATGLISVQQFACVRIWDLFGW
jgi:hypothetical protein